jgi:hypothetical protein
VYNAYDPPYVLLIAGLLVSIASGVAFDKVLRQSVQDWSKNRSTRRLTDLQGTQLFLPFFGISLGVCLFLGAGMGIFGFPPKFSFGIALPLTVLSSWLIWSQLGKIFVQLEQGGSSALDLDSL